MSDVRKEPGYPQIELHAVSFDWVIWLQDCVLVHRLWQGA
jgi:hypothetical protein